MLILIMGASSAGTCVCILIDLIRVGCILAAGGCPAVQCSLQLAVMPQAGELADEGFVA